MTKLRKRKIYLCTLAWSLVEASVEAPVGPVDGPVMGSVMIEDEDANDEDDNSSMASLDEIEVRMPSAGPIPTAEEIQE